MENPIATENSTLQTDRGDELALLLRLGRHIATELDLDRLLDQVAEMGRELIQADTLVVPIINPERNEYVYRSASGKNADRILGQSFPLSIGMCGWVLSTEQALLFGKGHEWMMGEPTTWEEGMTSALLVPLLARGRIIGGLSGLGRAGGGSFTQRDLDLLTLFANQTGIAIDNAQIFRDLKTEREQVEKLLWEATEAKERILVTLESIADGVIITDAENRIKSINPAGQKLLQQKQRDLIDHKTDSVFELLSEIDNRPLKDPVTECLLKNEVIRHSDFVVLNCHSGNRFAAELSAAPLRLSDGTISGAILVFRDVSKARALKQELTHHATHDQLTGLINRRHFEQRLAEAFNSAKHSNDQHVMGYLDIDQFKIVNDTCGHAAGDELLRQLATQLKICMRGSDSLARLGGDEFGLLLENCGLEKGLEVAEHMRGTVEKFRFAWEGKPFSIGISIGLVPITQDTPSIGEIFSTADTACYSAKEEGRNRVHVTEVGSADIRIKRNAMEWTTRIRNALDKDLFCLYQQDIQPFDPSLELPIYHEILLRLRDENNILYSPGSFLPAAERYDLMPSIDRWVIHHAFEWIHRHGDPTGGQRYSINLSGASLNDGRLGEYIQQMSVNYGTLLQYICFEITETVAIANLQKALALMHTLRILGCEFALDDFGSGMSSFSYLKTLPVDFIKIDGGLVKDIQHDAIDLATIRSITELGHLMGKRIVAEFVEDATTHTLLRNLGIEYGQGYHIHKPEPLAE